ncbi:MAG: helix-turn-helix domain-containing protein [Bacteroidales bacterium]|nr:helix-turn-helix domain-containing protein [Bacteroidales bacterium]
MKQAQTQKILEYMKQCGSITPAEAMHEFGCMRLAARIADLKTDGVQIKAERVAAKNRFGETVSFAKYSLVG